MKRAIIIPLLCMLFMQHLYAADFSQAIQAVIDRSLRGDTDGKGVLSVTDVVRLINLILQQ